MTAVADLTVVDHTHFFIGDTHFGHVGILDFAMRPQPTIQLHDQELVANWNALVKPTDTVWHLGDFAGDDVPFEYAASVFRKLNGVKRLIVGNHDGDAIQALPWISVDVMRTLVAPGCKVVLCHYPMRDWNGKHGGDLHFHGHSHDRLPSSRQSWDCGVDRQGFKPMTFADIKDRMDKLDHWDFAGAPTDV